MALAGIGLLASLGLYLGAIFGFSWSSTRRVAAAEAHGIQIGPAIPYPPPAEIAKRHGVEWPIALAGLFLILAIWGIPLWQRVGMAALLAIVIGSMWFAQAESGGQLPNTSAVMRMGSDIWYWLLACLDWLGLLAALCFATELIWTAV